MYRAKRAKKTGLVAFKDARLKNKENGGRNEEKENKEKTKNKNCSSLRRCFCALKGGLEKTSTPSAYRFNRRERSA